MKQEIKDRVEQIREGVVPDGYKETRVGIIPEDWEVKDLTDISTENGIVRGPFGGALKKDVFVQDGYKVYQQGNAIRKSAEYGSYYIDAKKYNELSRFSVQKDDFIISCSGTIGRIYRIPKGYQEGVINQALLKITVNPESMARNFFQFVFESPRFQDYITENTQGGAMKNIVGMKIFRKTNIQSPPILEQQKIAAILSTWDRAIELKESLIKEKEEQKKGLMQELLTPVDSNQWFKVKLRDLGKTYNGLTGKTSKDFGTGKKFITFKNIFDNPKLNLNVIDRVLLKEGEKQNMIKYGDVFFTTSSETPHEVGMSSVLLDEIEEDIYLNSFCFGFRLNNFEEVLPEFLRYYLRGDSFRYEMMRLSQGSTRFNLSKTEFLKVTLEVPSISQQQRIAKVLSTTDQEIDLLKQEVEQLKEQKKGLMQLLLTGIVRVKEAVMNESKSIS